MGVVKFHLRIHHRIRRNVLKTLYPTILLYMLRWPTGDLLMILIIIERVNFTHYYSTYFCRETRYMYVPAQKQSLQNIEAATSYLKAASGILHLNILKKHLVFLPKVYSSRKSFVYSMASKELFIYKPLLFFSSKTSGV